MLHKTIKAAATTTDRGEFEAIAATYAVDRTQERIIPGAFAKTIEQWQSSGKRIPLHWDHSGDAADIIGSVDPTSMKETADGLYVKGQLDLQDSDVAKEAWRSMKNNAVALSFGFLSDTRKGEDGITELVNIDLFEISIVPGPANPDTRLLSLKNANGQATTEDDTDETAKVVVHDGKQLTVASDTERCPVDRPFALSREGDLVSCHVTEEEAQSAMQDEMKGSDPGDEKTLRRETDEMVLDQARDGLKAEKVETLSEEDRIRAIVREVVTEAVEQVKAEVKTELEKSLPPVVEDGSDEEPEGAKSAPQDPLKKRTFDAALEISNGGMRVREHIEPDTEPEPEPSDAAALRRCCDELALEIARS